MSSVAGLVNCAVTPIANERTTISFDGNEPNGGIIRNFEDHSSEITPSARDRYNNLILSQDGFLTYTTKRDFGVTPLPNGNYRITAEGKEYWYSLKLESEDVTK